MASIAVARSEVRIYLFFTRVIAKKLKTSNAQAAAGQVTPQEEMYHRNVDVGPDGVGPDGPG